MRKAAATVLLVALVFASPAAAQSLKENEVLSSLIVHPLSEPRPVKASDGRVHLAYELLLVNVSHWFVALDSLESLGPSDQVLARRDGAELAAVTQFHASRDDTIPPGGAATVVLDIALPPGEAVPADIRSRLTLTRKVEKNGALVPDPEATVVPATLSFTAAPVVVPGRPAIVLSPPLRGKGWVAADGCCDSITAHRGALLAINGRQRAPERFANDWVQLAPDGKLFAGEGTQLADYAFYGAPILSAADGVVVNLYDEADEQGPGPQAKPTGIIPANIGGNMVVVDIGDGAYAFYAHLQRGSLKVKLGDRVKTGDVLGLLGNTGNSTAPHLHFHVMDGPSPLDSNGLPYVFTGFSSPGTLAPGNEEELLDGAPARILPELKGRFTHVLPLNDQVVDFD